MSVPSAEILYFTGANCRICTVMTPLVEEIADGFAGDVLFTPLDAATHRSRASDYDVMAVPTIVALSDGIEMGRSVGAQTRGSLVRLFDASVSGKPPVSVMNPRNRLLRVGFAVALGVLAVSTGQMLVWPFAAAALIAAFWDKVGIR